MTQRLTVCALLALGVLATSPAWAQDDDDDEENAFVEYWKRTGNYAGVGLNGILTFHADPVMDTVQPPEEFEELPAGAVTGRFLGLGLGVFRGGYRILTGATDILLCPFEHVMVSPEPRVPLVPFIEHEEF